MNSLTIVVFKVAFISILALISSDAVGVAAHSDFAHMAYAKPTAIAVSPPDLLNKALAASNAKGSVHFHSTEYVHDSSGPPLGVDVQGDVSWHDLVEHTRLVRYKAGEAHRQLHEWTDTVIVKSRSATRVGKGKWSCNRESVKGAYPIIIHGRLSQLRVIGRESVQGRHTWILEGRANERRVGITSIFNVVLYIDVKTFLILKERATIAFGHGPAPSILETILMFSHFGEPVHARLPLQCL